MRPKKNEKRYIPKPLKELLQNIEYKRKDDLYCIIDLIYRKQVYFRNKLQEHYGYCQIAIASFENIVPSKERVMAGIAFLIEQGIIKRNEYYVRSLEAKGYKVCREYLGTKTPVEITDDKINKAIQAYRNKTKKVRVAKMEYEKSKYYKTFKIMVPEALQAAKDKAIWEIHTLLLNLKYSLSNDQINDVLECTGEFIKHRNIILSLENGRELHNILHRLMVHQQHIYSIADGFLYFKRNDTNGRLNTNLTSMPTYLRKFIISDDTLVNLDIKNSQPYFLYTKLRNEPGLDKAEVERYGNLVVTGQIYEYFSEVYEKATGRRKERLAVKKMLFKIFYSKVTSFPNYKDVFRSVFPSIMEYIDAANHVHYNTLAIAMQTMESHAILDVVMPACKAVGITPLTVHDSFIVSEKEAPIVKEIFERCFQQMFELVPSMHYEYLCELVQDDNEDELDELFFLTDGYDNDDESVILETFYLR